MKKIVCIVLIVCFAIPVFSNDLLEYKDNMKFGVELLAGGLTSLSLGRVTATIGANELLNGSYSDAITWGYLTTALDLTGMLIGIVGSIVYYVNVTGLERELDKLDLSLQDTIQENTVIASE